MVEEADGFLVLPGGAGTLEEIFDMIMLRQLGRHQKPAAFVDADFWGRLKPCCFAWSTPASLRMM